MSKLVNKDLREKTLKLLDEPEPDDSIQREFLDFHGQNPHVYKFLVHYTSQAVREMKKRGIADPQYSISAVIERVRWHVNFEVKGYPDFKINNDYRSRYARMIMKTVPKLRGVFTLRKIGSKSTPEQNKNASLKQQEGANGDQQRRES